MNDAWKQLHPQDSFIVKIAKPIERSHEQALSFLYQPVIGIDAFGLYHTLLSSVDPSGYDSYEQRHAELFNQLLIDLPRLYKARSRLEGIGLLKVYVQQTKDQRRFLYELFPPQTAQAFLSDDVLSLLLIDSVGQVKYEQLVKRFKIPKIETTEYLEVTQKFLDVYEWHEQSMSSHQDLFTQTKSQLEPSSMPKIDIKDASFDWDYFLESLNGLYLDKRHLEQEGQETIYTLHKLYGIDELEMKRLLEPEIDYSTNQVNFNSLRQQIIKHYHKPKKQVIDSSQVDHTAGELTKEEQKVRRKNTLLQKGFTPVEVNVILSSEAFNPMVFLDTLKRQKGGFVANEERWTLENIVKQSGLPDAVINVLVHFILVARDNKMLNAKYANSIANDWAQTGIKTPEAALTKVKELVLETGESKNVTKAANQKRYYNNKAPLKKESLPEWVDQKNEETPVSKEEEEFFKEQLRQLRKPKEEGGS